MSYYSELGKAWKRVGDGSGGSEISAELRRPLQGWRGLGIWSVSNSGGRGKLGWHFPRQKVAVAAWPRARGGACGGGCSGDLVSVRERAKSLGFIGEEGGVEEKADARLERARTAGSKLATGHMAQRTGGVMVRQSRGMAIALAS